MECENEFEDRRYANIQSMLKHHKFKELQGPALVYIGDDKSPFFFEILPDVEKLPLV